MRSKRAAVRLSNAKKQVRLGRAFDGCLKDYSLAAAGIGALALAAPAHASIATTAPNLSVLDNGTTTYIPVVGFANALAAINHEFEGTTFDGSVKVVQGAAGAIRWFGKSATSFPVPASAGSVVPTGVVSFGKSALLVQSGSSTSQDKNFLGTGKYIGFAIGTGASAHYGWLKLNISGSGDGGYTVTVTNTAIEQCPGQPITIGQTSGGATCVPTTPAPNSLWLLSLGVAGLAGLEALRRLRKTA